MNNAQHSLQNSLCPLDYMLTVRPFFFISKNNMPAVKLKSHISYSQRHFNLSKNNKSEKIENKAFVHVAWLLMTALTIHVTDGRDVKVHLNSHFLNKIRKFSQRQESFVHLKHLYRLAGMPWPGKCWEDDWKCPKMIVKEISKIVLAWQSDNFFEFLGRLYMFRKYLSLTPQ